MRVVGPLRDTIIAKLSDHEAQQIIRTVLTKPKTVGEIEKELDLPQSTLYKKVSELKECGLLMVEEFVFSTDGKKEALYACPFTEVRIKVGHVEMELDLIETKESLARRWFELFSSRSSASHS